MFGSFKAILEVSADLDELLLEASTDIDSSLSYFAFLAIMTEVITREMACRVSRQINVKICQSMSYASQVIPPFLRKMSMQRKTSNAKNTDM